MTSTTTTPSLVFLLVSKALTLRPETESLPTPPREGIAGANADHADAEDFQARVRSYHCRLQPGALVAHCPGVLPLWCPQPWYFAVLGSLQSSNDALLAVVRCSCMRIPGFTFELT